MRVCARQAAYLASVALRIRDYLPQPLDESACCHSEPDKEFLLGGAAVWHPHEGELDEKRHFGIGMSAIPVEPGGATPLAALSILMRIHRFSHLPEGFGAPVVVRSFSHSTVNILIAWRRVLRLLHWRPFRGRAPTCLLAPGTRRSSCRYSPAVRRSRGRDLGDRPPPR